MKNSKSLSRRDFLKLGGSALLGATLGGCSWHNVLEKGDLAKLPPPPAGAPNVLLIVLDTVRARSLSLYGYEGPTTPQLERIAKDGVLFQNAITPAPWTLPSHASMFTGHFPHELSTGWESALDGTYPTLAETLRDQGYATAGFAANNYYCTYEYGLDRGFLHYEDYRVTPGQIALSSSVARQLLETLKIEERLETYKNFGRKSAEQVTHDFLHWLSRDRESRPFFAFLNYYDAHDPYLPPLDFALKFAPKRPLGHLNPAIAKALNPDVLHQLNEAYDGAIAYIDHSLGHLYDELSRLSLLENTLVIITADHGEQFGEHGLMTHGNSLYLNLVHVPLMILFPSRVPQEIKVSPPVSLRDIAATVLDLTALPAQSPFPGKSLARHWEASSKEETAASEVNITWDINEVPLVKGRMKSLVYENMHYIKNPDGREELFDFTGDPGESHNLADLGENSQILDFFRSSL